MLRKTHYGIREKSSSLETEWLGKEDIPVEGATLSHCTGQEKNQSGL